MRAGVLLWLCAAGRAGAASPAAAEEMEKAALHGTRELSFVTGHRLLMVSPGPADDLTDEAGAVEVVFRATLERWPLTATATELALPIVLDGRTVDLVLPHAGWPRCAPSGGSGGGGGGGGGGGWGEATARFCAAVGLSEPNCKWLTTLVGELDAQLAARGGARLGEPDDEVLARARCCLTAALVPPDGGASRAPAPSPQRPARTVCAAFAAGEVRLRLPRLEAGTHALRLSVRQAALTAGGGGGGGLGHGGGHSEGDGGGNGGHGDEDTGDGAGDGVGGALPGHREVSMASSLVVHAAACARRGAAPRVDHPRHGALLGPSQVLVLALSAPDGRSLSDADGGGGEHPGGGPSSVCLSLDGAAAGCVDWPLGPDGAVLEGLGAGRHRLEAWWAPPPIGVNGSSSGGDGGGGGNGRSGPHARCVATCEFEVDPSLAGRARAGGVVDPSSEATTAVPSLAAAAAAGAAGSAALLFVTGASERYVADGILQNLVGSVHFWEPAARVEVWDFGLGDGSRALVRSWARVDLMTLPSPSLSPSRASLPPHLHVPGFGAYAAKPWVTLDALRRAKTVLWIDANCELRRPLFGTAALARALFGPGPPLMGGGGGVGGEHGGSSNNRDGSGGGELGNNGGGAFFVTHPYGFPTPQFHHPQAVAALGCPATVPEGSLPHCATTLMAFTVLTAAGRRAVEEILAPLAVCGLDPACVHPPGSDRTNHRQEQTALNAILCSLSHGGGHGSGHGGGGSSGKYEGALPLAPPLSAAALCSPDPRYRLTSDRENLSHELQPTADPRDWNDMAIYTRRGHPYKPYAPFLELRGEVEVELPGNPQERAGT